MIKSALAATAALPLLGSAALAGPYVNVEANSGWTGSDYEGSVIESHVGFEGELSSTAGYYVQAGPALVAVDGEDTTTELSGKAGVGVDVTESLNLYGELAFITIDGQDENGYGAKLGAKFTF